MRILLRLLVESHVDFDRPRRFRRPVEHHGLVEGGPPPCAVEVAVRVSVQHGRSDVHDVTELVGASRPPLHQREVRQLVGAHRTVYTPDYVVEVDAEVTVGIVVGARLVRLAHANANTVRVLGNRRPIEGAPRDRVARYDLEGEVIGDRRPGRGAVQRVDRVQDVHLGDRAPGIPFDQRILECIDGRVPGHRLPQFELADHVKDVRRGRDCRIRQVLDNKATGTYVVFDYPAQVVCIGVDVVPHVRCVEADCRRPGGEGDVPGVFHIAALFPGDRVRHAHRPELARRG